MKCDEAISHDPPVSQKRQSTDMIRLVSVFLSYQNPLLLNFAVESRKKKTKPGKEALVMDLVSNLNDFDQLQLIQEKT